MAAVDPEQQQQQKTAFQAQDEIQYNNKLYDKIRVLGQGSFGTAIVHRRRADCSLVVLKEIDLSKFKGEKERSLAINEARIMSTLNHVNIIKYFNSFTTETKLIIEMEYASLGTLISFLTLHGPLDEQEILIIFRQITSGLNYLHSKSIIHLDLKMTNIFVSIEGFVKIGDFGIAQYMNNEHVTSLSSQQSNSPVGQLGTLAYSSPERCTGEKTDSKSDIWSLGCILYELITCEPLFRGESLPEMVYCITHIQYQPIKRKISPPIRDLFEQMIALSPERRPNAYELLCLVDQILSRLHVRASSQRRAQLNKKRHHNHRFELSTEFFSQNHQAEMTQINYLHSLVYQVKLDTRHVQVDRVNLPQSKRIKEISKGKYHYLVLTYDNIVYGWGRKSYGQLGACGLTQGHHLSRLASLVPAVPPTPVQSTPSSLASSTQTIIMSPALSQQQQQQQQQPRQLATKTSNLQLTRQLVISMLRESQPATKPFVLNELNHRKIIQVAAGNNFSVFLTKTGIVMTCGHGLSGCLGRGEILDACFMPCMVDSLLNMDVVCIASGPNHVVAVCGNGKAYSWGKGTCGRLGVGRITSVSSSGHVSKSKMFSNYVLRPQLCLFPEGVMIKQVFCGDRCTIFIDSDRKCWACGENKFNKLGLDIKRRFKRTLVVDKCWIPMEITALSQYEVVTCNIGKNHTSFVTADDRMIVFGQDIDHGYRLESDIIDARRSHRRISFELQTSRKMNAKTTNTNLLRVCDHERLVMLALRSNQISGYKLKPNDLNTSSVGDEREEGDARNNLKLDKDLQKQLDLYMKKSRAIKRMPFDSVIGATCTPKFTLTLTDDNRVYFWGTRTYKNDNDCDNIATNSNDRKSIDPQLASTNSDDCFIKIGKTNNSLMASIQKLGSDQPIIHAQDPRLRANSLADLWILDYKPTEQHSSSSSSASSSLSSLSVDASCVSTCCSSCCPDCNPNSKESDNLKHDVILEPQPIISLYVPSMFNHPSCSVRLVDLFCFDENKFYLILDTTVKMQQQQQQQTAGQHYFSSQYPHNQQYQIQRHLGHQSPGGGNPTNNLTPRLAANGSALTKKHSFSNLDNNGNQLRSMRLGSLSSNIRLARENEPQIVEDSPARVNQTNDESVVNEQLLDDIEDLKTIVEGKLSQSDSQTDSNNNDNVKVVLATSANFSDVSDHLVPNSQFGVSSLDEPRSFSTFANGLDNQIIIGPSMRRHDLQDQHLQPLNFNSPTDSSPLDVNFGSPEEEQYFRLKRRQRTRLKTDKSESTTNGGGGDQDETSSMPSWVRNEFNQVDVNNASRSQSSNGLGGQMFVFESPEESSEAELEFKKSDNEEDIDDEDALTCVSESRLFDGLPPSDPASLRSIYERQYRSLSQIDNDLADKLNIPEEGYQVDEITNSSSSSSCAIIEGSYSTCGDQSGSERINIDREIVQTLSPGKRMLAHSLSQPDMLKVIHSRRSDEELPRINYRRNSMAEGEDQQTNLLDCKVYQDSQRQQKDTSDASNLCLDSRTGSHNPLIRESNNNNLMAFSNNCEPSRQRIFWSKSDKYSIVKSHQKLDCGLKPQLGDPMLSQSVQITVTKPSSDRESSDKSYHRIKKAQSTKSVSTLRKSLLRLFC